jgi:hypothetical protein
MSARSISTIGDMAAILGVDRTLVSKYLTGSRQCHDIAQLRHFAQVMDLPPETFGLVASPEDPPTIGGRATPEAHQWRLVRQTLNRNRSELTSIAAGLYWEPVRIAGTTCITLPEWLPPQPVPLDRIEMQWSEAQPPMISGAEEHSVACRPHGPTGDRYARYSQAIRGLASPALFENRVSYRLLDLNWALDGGRMAFGHTTYFDMLDVCEVLAHETAAASLREGSTGKRLAL